MKIREFLPEFLLTQISSSIPAIQHDIRTLQQNLCSILPCPVLHSPTCSVPSRDQLWTTIETPNTIHFNFSPIYHQNFSFILIKTKLQKKFKDIPESALKDLFKMVPTLQLASKGLTFCQPITQSVQLLPSDADNVMGIDLGLKTLATCSIGTFEEEIARKFISFKNLLTSQVDPLTGRFIRQTVQPARSANIPNRLRMLRKTVWRKHSELDLTTNPSRKAYLEREITRSWTNMRNLHIEIRNQMSQKIVALARAHHVGVIKFEDLRWSAHSSKEDKGGWLAHHQIDWFHGQIIDHVSQLAARFGIRVVLVNANLSSQLDSEQVRLTGQGRSVSSRAPISNFPALCGKRQGKVYHCLADATGYQKQLDSDLNAARNIRMRVPIT
jgi:IS605 OrfB family transposase